jgi:hypothetical protein
VIHRAHTAGAFDGNTTLRVRFDGNGCGKKRYYKEGFHDSFFKQF